MEVIAGGTGQPVSLALVGDRPAGRITGAVRSTAPAAPMLTNLSGRERAPMGLGHCRSETTTEGELTFLKDEAEGLKHYLEGIERRISELQKIAE